MNDIEQIIKDKSDISKMIMKRIKELSELLNEVGESEICGCGDGWEYNFKKIEKTLKENQ